MSDCVSREYLLNHRTHIIADGLRIPVIELDTVINAPAVEPERPTGHWIIHSEHCKSLGVQPSGLGEYYWCSQCNCGIDSKAFHMIEYNFCPHCGAKMENNA